MEGVKSSYTEEQKHRIFESEFLPHIDAMYNFAYRITYDEDRAKDLLQETYYKAVKNILKSNLDRKRVPLDLVEKIKTRIIKES